MTRLITNTNIIVDDFDFCKSFPADTFVHFLTHFHSDHYEGLSPLWDYSEIHCTHQTKIFLMDKYPKLKRVHSYDYYTRYQIQIVKAKLKVDVIFFDAKHIPGSAMILFQGYMGSILFTGDFRYNYDMVKENHHLFPLNYRKHQYKQDIVQKMAGISIHVDEMIFDNTYCNSAFKFETEDPIMNMMIEIIEKNKHKKLVYICMGALGKHRILMKICEHFQTNIVVDDDQFNRVKLAKLRVDFLTTDPAHGFIRLINKKRRAEIIEQTKKSSFGDSFICIDIDFLMLEHTSPDQINYIVPYSLHSNFKEMETLIRMIQPSILRKIVIPFAKTQKFKQMKLRIKIDHRLKFAKYLDFIESKIQNSQAGYSSLVKNYTKIYELSKQFLEWFDSAKQKRLMHELGLGDGTQNHNLRKRKVILLEEDELSSRTSKDNKSLRSIADSLNAVHKNLSLERAFQNQAEKKVDKFYSQIFDQTEEDYTRSYNQAFSSKNNFESITQAEGEEDE